MSSASRSRALAQTLRSRACAATTLRDRRSAASPTDVSVDVATSRVRLSDGSGASKTLSGATQGVSSSAQS